MTPPLKLSVVIATFNRRDVLARTLPTLFAQDFPQDEYEVVVVVDGSTDGTIEMLRGLKPACALRILEQPNRGQAVAQNKGWNAARGCVVLFLDDDDLCDRALVQEHVTAHSGADPLVVFGPVLFASESTRGLAGDWMRACTEQNLGRWAGLTDPQFWDITLILPNPNVSMPRSALVACGGFDEGFGGTSPSVLADADVGLRLWKLGLRFRYRPGAVVHQLYVKSAGDIIKDARSFGRSEVLQYRKHPDWKPYSGLAYLAQGPGWRRLCREVAARFPVSLEPLLRVPFWVAERLRSVPQVRHAGIRLLQRRQAIVMLRSALHQAGSWRALYSEFGRTLPVLLYHHVGPGQPGTFPSLTVSPQRFERQLRNLARQGYVGITPSDWLAWCRGGKVLPDKPVLLTFDDAYADLAHHALPVLRRYGFSAAVFVVTGRIGGTNTWDEELGKGTHRLMTTEQIREWATQGIEFGAHSRTHSDLTTLSGAKLAEEVAGSGRDLAGILGTRVVSFAYPYGLHNESVRSCVRDAFDLAFGTDEGLNDLSTDPHLLRRTMVQPSDSWMELRWRVHLGRNPMQRFRSNFAGARRRLVGPKP